MGLRRVLWAPQGGFTLGEVLITILLMGILFAIATSTWFGLVEGRKVDAAANQLAGDLRRANTGATNQLTDWRLVFRADGSRVACGSGQADYCLVRLSSPAPAVPPPVASESIPRFLPSGTRILGTNLLDDATSQKSIEFNSDGSAESVGGLVPAALPTDPLTVRVGVADGEARTVAVVRSTSRVKSG